MRRSRIDRRGVAATYFGAVPNRGVEVASGDWMALLDADTSAAPSKQNDGYAGVAGTEIVTWNAVG